MNRRFNQNELTALRGIIDSNPGVSIRNLAKIAYSTVTAAGSAHVLYSRSRQSLYGQLRKMVGDLAPAAVTA
jgi:hypothetical protein